MRLQLRSALLSLRDLLLTGGPVLLLAIGLFWLAYRVLDPIPPQRMVLATGGAQGAYAEFGRLYRDALARQGIEVELRATRGALDNLALLRSGDEDRPSDELLSLGALFREPVWIFYREDSARARLGGERLESLSQIAEWRLNVGQEGSGITHLMHRLLIANGLEPAKLPLSQLPTTPAVMALLDGQLDALALVSAPESPIVRMLLITPGIRLFDFAQAEAYARRVPQVAPVLLPRGVVDLAQDLPGQDVRLVAATASLLVREDTHPALQQLLVQAARRIHSEPNWFQDKGEYPKAQTGDHPLSPEAQRFYASGEPLLQRHLPFGYANLIDRMWVVLLSIVAVLIPLSRVVPPLYNFRVRSRIFRWYGLLREIEQQHAEGSRPLAALRAELDQLDARIERLPVPLSYADELYSLRSHIAMVRQRLDGTASPSSISPATPDDPARTST